MTDIPAFGPDSYSHPGVPRRKLSDPVVHMSRLYPGMKTEYRVYVPAQYDSTTPAALMIRQDGHYYFERDGPLRTPPAGQPPSRLQNVIDNLTNRKDIPVAIYLLIDPGTVGTTAMRSIQYDTVSDLYPRFLRDEILPRVFQPGCRSHPEFYLPSMETRCAGWRQHLSIPSTQRTET
ncbi:MAG: hypothetical protein M3N54_02940 [Acidobacteriota bacterium]|nr:hypothetical protein [Acidobacteriota bacterium]